MYGYNAAVSVNLNSATSVDAADIVVRNVSRRTLSQVSLTCPAGKVTAIVGPSGCGKSTLLRLIAGLEEADTGGVMLGNNDPHVRQSRGEIGFAFQSPTLLPWRTVRQNIELPLDLLERQDREAVDYVIKLTHLEDLASRLPNELSGGQAQRASLARALVTRPTFLLLDEPFTALDFMLRRRLNGHLKTWLSEFKSTTVLVTHDPREALLLADHVVVLGERPTVVLLSNPVSPPKPGAPGPWHPDLEACYEAVLSALDRGSS